MQDRTFSFTGLLTICFISPKHKNVIETIKNKNIDFREYLTLNGEKDKVEYITIPILFQRKNPRE